MHGAIFGSNLEFRDGFSGYFLCIGADMWGIFYGIWHGGESRNMRSVCREGFWRWRYGCGVVSGVIWAGWEGGSVGRDIFRGPLL